jgi:hypothetical protein
MRYRNSRCHAPADVGCGILVGKRDEPNRGHRLTTRTSRLALGGPVDITRQRRLDIHPLNVARTYRVTSRDPPRVPRGASTLQFVPGAAADDALLSADLRRPEKRSGDACSRKHFTRRRKTAAIRYFDVSPCAMTNPSGGLT